MHTITAVSGALYHLLPRTIAYFSKSKANHKEKTYVSKYYAYSNYEGLREHDTWAGEEYSTPLYKQDCNRLMKSQFHNAVYVTISFTATAYSA